ncbi:MAG: FHA domain-containing protein [Microbacterium sp.]|uniref:DUF5684 domain-containing protein n=1 Tax=Microbacterium sp. TaxID=51671 RepID=UPI001D8F3FCE|nr:DUF5684 domain-containing protein [Microbacterium sp.]MBW8762804.1 FHA domain-containing protein [Microbacterium sp.]
MIAVADPRFLAEVTAPDLVAASAVVTGVTALIGLGVYVWYAFALSKLFPKLEQDAWKGWVPVLNEATILQIGGRPAWNVVFYFIPIVQLYGLYLKVLATHDINKRFGRGAGFTVLAVLLPPVWATLLAWGAPPYPEGDRLAGLHGPRRVGTDAARAAGAPSGQGFLAAPIPHAGAAPGPASFAPAPGSFAPAQPAAPGAFAPQGFVPQPPAPGSGPAAYVDPRYSDAAAPDVTIPALNRTSASTVDAATGLPSPAFEQPAPPQPAPLPISQGLIDSVPGVAPHEPSATVEAEPQKPVVPVEPAAPAAPVGPVQPVEPSVPYQPVEPSQPAPPPAPVQPAEPTPPVSPVQPVAPHDPYFPVPAEPAPAEPAPAEPTWPASPAAPAHPAPADPAPAQPAWPAPFETPAPPAESVAPAQPVASAQPIAPAQPVAPAEPAGVAQPADPGATPPPPAAPQQEPLVSAPIPPESPAAPDASAPSAALGPVPSAAEAPASAAEGAPEAPASDPFAEPQRLRGSGLGTRADRAASIKPVPVVLPVPEPQVPVAAAAPDPATADDDIEATVVVHRSRGPRRVLVLDDGRTFALSATSIVIGRNPEGEPGEQRLSIPDKTRTLSKTHARLVVQGEEWRLTDLHSTNGVVVVADDGAETLLDAGESVTGAGRFVLGEVGMHVAVESGS